MDKRFFLALVLTAIVIVGVPLLVPGANRRPTGAARLDTASHTGQRSDTAATRSTASAPTAPSSGAAKSSIPVLNALHVAESTTVRTPLGSYTFTSLGGAPISVSLDSYPSRRPTALAQRVELVPPGASLARYRVALGADTVSLDTIPLRLEQSGSSTAATVPTAPTIAFSGQAAGRALRLSYTIVPDSFLLRVKASVAGAPPGSALLAELPRTLRSNEPDTLDDINHLAVSYRSRGEVASVGFSKLDSASVRIEPGPVNWVAARNKYFLVAYRADSTHPFSTLRLQGVPHTGKVASHATAMTVLPLVNGAGGFDIYAGPQDFERLQRLGHDLDQVNPYAGWFHGVVQPFAAIVMKALLWMKHTTQLNYGWVLILFGVLIRLALWPLNQSAMRTSLKMQRLQPELQAIQKKYSDDPKRQQEAIMKVYSDHGMSPLSPLMGCLPMLLPMPILFALYFVFQNTIEFRGVSFLWLPDISLRDPYYITPLLMGVSMFLMSWIGLKGSPPNPQAKMMSYMMPAVLTVVFLNLASGLNLYYAVQNIAAIPQQWLLARERTKAGPAPVGSVAGAVPAVKRRS